MLHPRGCGAAGRAGRDRSRCRARPARGTRRAGRRSIGRASARTGRGWWGRADPTRTPIHRTVAPVWSQDAQGCDAIATGPPDITSTATRAVCTGLAVDGTCGITATQPVTMQTGGHHDPCRRVARDPWRCGFRPLAAHRRGCWEIRKAIIRQPRVGTCVFSETRERWVRSNHHRTISPRQPHKGAVANRA